MSCCCVAWQKQNNRAKTNNRMREEEKIERERECGVEKALCNGISNDHEAFYYKRESSLGALVVVAGNARQGFHFCMRQLCFSFFFYPHQENIKKIKRERRKQWRTQEKIIKLN